MKYWVAITEHIALREYPTYRFSGFVDSNKGSADEVKSMILEHHKKKGLEELQVTVYKVEEKKQ